jgi:hypothetical protein
MKTLRGIISYQVMKASVIAALVSLVILTCHCVQAEPLNLWPHEPDITSLFIGVEYNAGDGILTASGSAGALYMSPTDIYDITSGAFDISMVLDTEGVPQSGSLTIRGSIDSLGIAGPILLTGDIDQFGFGDELDPGPLEFIFNVTGGDLGDAPYFPVAAAVLLHDSGFEGSFENNFSNFWEGSSDTYAVPEPSLWILLLTLTGSGLLASRRR